MSEVMTECGAVLPAFSGFNSEDLDVLIEAAQRRKAELKARELADLHQLASRIKDEASHLGINLYALLGLNEPSKAKVKTFCYKHPDKDRTWSGRGPKPGWIKELLATGTAIESLRMEVVDFEDLKAKDGDDW